MRRPPIHYSKKELAWVKENCTLEKNKLHLAFIEQFNRHDVSAANLIGLRKRNGWKTGRTGCFVKGHAPRGGGAKKGGNTGSFKAGAMPHNTLPLYSERICKKEGYILIKIPEPNPHTNATTRYKHKHIWLWEQKNGPTPKDHVIVFKNGNRLECEIANLECVPRSVLGQLNRRLKASEYPQEVRPTLLTLARLEDKKRKRARCVEDGCSDKTTEKA